MIKTDALVRLDRPEAALEVVESVLSADPDAVMALSSKAQALAGLQRYGPALEAVEHALDVGAGAAYLLTTRGDLLKGVGEYDEALRVLTEAAEHDPLDAGTRESIAWVLLALGRSAEALVAFDSAIDLGRPASLSAHAGKGDALLRLERFDEADEQYETVLERARAIEDASADIKSAVAWALHRMRDDARAAELLEPGVRQRYRLNDRFNRGLFLLSAGRPEEARDQFSDAVAATTEIADPPRRRGLTAEAISDLDDLELTRPSVDAALVDDMRPPRAEADERALTGASGTPRDELLRTDGRRSCGAECGGTQAVLGQRFGARSFEAGATAVREHLPAVVDARTELLGVFIHEPCAMRPDQVFALRQIGHEQLEALPCLFLATLGDVFLDLVPVGAVERERLVVMTNVESTELQHHEVGIAVLAPAAHE